MKTLRAAVHEEFAKEGYTSEQIDSAISTIKVEGISFDDALSANSESVYLAILIEVEKELKRAK